MTKLFDIKIEGFEEVFKTLDKLDDKLQKKVMRPALRAGATVIKKSAQAKSPVGKGPGAGKNKKHIKVKALKRSRNTIGVMIQTGTREQLNIPRDEFGYYPMILEYGSQKQKKQPFMKPALEQNHAKATNVIGKKVKSGLEKLLRGKKK